MRKAVFGSVVDYDCRHTVSSRLAIGLQVPFTSPLLSLSTVWRHIIDDANFYLLYLVSLGKNVKSKLYCVSLVMLQTQTWCTIRIWFSGRDSEVWSNEEDKENIYQAINTRTAYQLRFKDPRMLRSFLSSRAIRSTNKVAYRSIFINTETTPNPQVEKTSYRELTRFYEYQPIMVFQDETLCSIS